MCAATVPFSNGVHRGFALTLNERESIKYKNNKGVNQN